MAWSRQHKGESFRQQRAAFPVHQNRQTKNKFLCRGQSQGLNTNMRANQEGR